MKDRPWELAILQSIHALGGEAGLQDIYRKLPSFTDITDKDWRETEWGGRPAFQHQVRSHITNLCDAGDLQKVERGRYALTEKGRRRKGVAH